MVNPGIFHKNTEKRAMGRRKNELFLQAAASLRLYL